MKAVILATEQIFTLLTSGVLLMSLALILPGQVTKITPTVEENEIEQEALNLASAVMSDPELIYFDGNTYYRGVLDAIKLQSKSASNPYLRVFYPNSYARINITDELTRVSYTFISRDSQSEVIGNFINCIASAVNTEQIRACVPNRISSILDRGLPVSIRYSDTDIRVGNLTVFVVE
ncbi:MAG: hypothetical protein QXD72_01165 [Candidatus Aenigmatarchaeota archaeon]